MPFPPPPAGCPAHTSHGHAVPPQLLAGFVPRPFPKGYLLSTPGGGRDQVFIVDSGRLRVYLAGANRALSLSYLGPGDIYSTHTPTYVETVAPSRLWLMDTATFAARLSSEPGVHPLIMRVLGRLLNDAVTLVEDLAFREVPARLARFLLGLAERRGQAQPGGARLIALELTVEDIASLLGSTRQTVSSLMSQWQRDGLIERQGRRNLLIVAPAALAALCAPPP